MNSPQNINVERHSRNASRLATGLGWFSITVGLISVFAPRVFSRMSGAPDRPVRPRLIGVRELVSGIGILGSRNPGPWLWTRVAGDIMDLALFGADFGNRRSNKKKLATSTLSLAGILVADVISAGQHTRQLASKRRRQPVRVVRCIIVDQSPAELYKAWRHLENLPQFISNLESLRVIDEKTSHWVMKGPAGRTVEWEAEITVDRPNQEIAWRSVGDVDMENSGSVQFAPATVGSGTVVRAEMNYLPPGGIIGAVIAKLFGKAPEQQMEIVLHRFEQWMEIGSVTTTEGQPSGRPNRNPTLYDVAINR